MSENINYVMVYIILSALNKCMQQNEHEMGETMSPSGSFLQSCMPSTLNIVLYG